MYVVKMDSGWGELSQFLKQSNRRLIHSRTHITSRTEDFGVISPTEKRSSIVKDLFEAEIHHDLAESETKNEPPHIRKLRKLKARRPTKKLRSLK